MYKQFTQTSCLLLQAQRQQIESLYDLAENIYEHLQDMQIKSFKKVILSVIRNTHPDTEYTCAISTLFSFNQFKKHQF